MQQIKMYGLGGQGVVTAAIGARDIGWMQLKHHTRNNPLVNLRIGPILGHLFYPTGKPKDSRSGVAKGLQ